MARIVLIHGMFQNPKSWEGWIRYLEARGHECVAPAWPLHEGEPSALRDNPPPGLGELGLDAVIASVEKVVTAEGRPIVIGHSVGGLIVQILASRGLVSAGVAVNSVAPNAMLDFDWDFFKNSATIANPLKGNEPAWMDAETFHGSFANTLSESEAAQAFERTATHDSRNVFRDCMGSSGRIDLGRPHAPLLLIGGEEDRIIPADLNRKNFEAYEDPASVTELKIFPGRSHFICNEPGWEDVAGHAADWIEGLDRNASAAPLSGT